MAVGDVVTAHSSVNSGGYLDIRPPSGTEWVIHNLYWGAAMAMGEALTLTKILAIALLGGKGQIPAGVSAAASRILAAAIARGLKAAIGGVTPKASASTEGLDASAEANVPAGGAKRSG